MRGPDFFLVGAPKCGTTAMADFLGQHPDIGMCRWKETHYLAGDLYWTRFGPFRNHAPPGDDEYLTFFEDVQDRARLGEASVWYLHSPTSARAIKAYSPDADILVMLRNPLEMIPSLHAQLVYIGIEHERDLERALALDPVRARSGPPKGFPSDSYLDAASFAAQLARYLDVFGLEKVHVVRYDDFAADPLASYQSICSGLGVANDFAPEIGVVNPRRHVRSQKLQQVLSASPARLQRTKVIGKVQAWNTPMAAKASLPAPAARYLLPLVTEQAQELGHLLGWDLSEWVRQAEAAAAPAWKQAAS